MTGSVLHSENSSNEEHQHAHVCLNTLYMYIVSTTAPYIINADNVHDVMAIAVTKCRYTVHSCVSVQRDIVDFPVSSCCMACYLSMSIELRNYLINAESTLLY